MKLFKKIGKVALNVRRRSTIFLHLWPHFVFNNFNKISTKEGKQCGFKNTYFLSVLLISYQFLHTLSHFHPHQPSSPPFRYHHFNHPFRTIRALPQKHPRRVLETLHKSLSLSSRTLGCEADECLKRKMGRKFVCISSTITVFIFIEKT